MIAKPPGEGRDLYEVLQVAPDATAAEIHSSYRRLARALHPDSAPTTADAAGLQLVVDAHRVLADPGLRRAYDRRRDSAHGGERGPSPVVAGPGGTPGSSGRTGRPVACPVCRGRAVIASSCAVCSATGRILTEAPWMRVALPCPSCAGTGRRSTRCGACGASGVVWRRHR